MEAYKFRDGQQVRAVATCSDIFSNFFTFPQYSRPSSIAMNVAVERHSSIADIEVTKVESHASIKIQAKRKPKQLLKMVAEFQSFCLNILHLNITTVDQSVLYSFSVKVCSPRFISFFFPFLQAKEKKFKDYIMMDSKPRPISSCIRHSITRSTLTIEIVNGCIPYFISDSHHWQPLENYKQKRKKKCHCR